METEQTQSVITGKEGSPIATGTAVEWTRNHRDRNPNDTISHHFGHETISEIINQSECMGLRIYYANSEKLNGWQKMMHGIGNFFINASGSRGKRHLILTGVACDGTDQLPAEGAVTDEAPHTFAARAAGGNGSTYNQSTPCPGAPGCPSNRLTGA